MSDKNTSQVDVLVEITKRQVNWLLADCRTQRRYIREDQKFGRGVLVNSAPPPSSVLRGLQRDLASLRFHRNRALRCGAVR